MNYRHAYHAGNHADILKHITLTLILEYLQIKPAPFRVFDAHAAIGFYDLEAEEAEKTLEWRDGVGRLFDESGAPIPLSELAEILLESWRSCVTKLNKGGALKQYPGSPEVAHQMIRRGDGLRLNELHEADYETLRVRYDGGKDVGLTKLDAAHFIKSQLPPPERRGLVLIDPPYEKTDEAQKALTMLKDGLDRFATGVFVLWYPITGDGLGAEIRDGVRALGGKNLIAELLVREAEEGGGLAGSGVAVINPPYVLRGHLEALLPEIAERLSQGAHSHRLEGGRG